MYTFQREKIMSLMMLDSLQNKGEIDMLQAVRKLMEWRPNILEIDARRAVSSWLLRESRKKDGMRGWKVREGKLPRKSANTEFEDFAPIGFLPCPEHCDYGNILDGIPCQKCNGVGYVNMDGSIVQ